LIGALTFDDISPTYVTSSKLRWIIDFVDHLDVACTFFVVPDDNMLHASEEFRSYLKKAVNSGHELSMHGLMHRKNEFGVFYPIPLPLPLPNLRRQKELIEKGSKRLLNLFEVRPHGFRAPNYLYNSNTIKALASLGFTYDSSATIFKTTHCSAFRIKWLRDCRPFAINGILEIPVSGDYTYNLEGYGYADSLRVALRDFELLRLSDGVFVVNNHPHRFREVEAQFLGILMKKLRREVIFQKLAEVADRLLGLPKNVKG
jgi:peptidoglycan/xylan/chitin deacetylase (PgdA/CDA1 family)